MNDEGFIGGIIRPIKGTTYFVCEVCKGQHQKQKSGKHKGRLKAGMKFIWRTHRGDREVCKHCAKKELSTSLHYKWNDLG